jgi:site-specific DNA recombinase
MNTYNNTAIYIRISTDREEQETSLQNQKELCMEIVEEKHWKLHKVYIDKVSGRVFKRPEFQSLLSDMENGLIQYIVVKEGSRLARNVSTFERIREIAFKKNIHLISVDGELDTFSKGYECITQVGADAQKEAERISKRVKNSLRMQVKRGEFIGSIAPYGYTLENKKLYPSKDEAIINTVRRIFNSYLNGKGARTIARELQDENIPTPSMIAQKRNATSNWNDTTIYGILENEVYIGNLVQSVEETYVANEERKRKRKTKDAYIKVENTHEPIILRHIFDSVQKVKSSKPKTGAKGQNHVFSNILFCKDCGSRLIYKSSWKDGSYVCSKYAKKGKDYCSNHAVNENSLLTYIGKQLYNYNKFNFEVYIQKAERKLNQLIRKLEGNISAIKFEISNIENRIDSIHDEILDFPFKKVELEKQLSKQIHNLETRKLEVTRIEHRVKSLKSPQTISKVTNELENTYYLKRINLMTINMFISRIEVNEDKALEIHYRFNNAVAS